MYKSKVIARKVVANNTVEIEVSKPVGYEYIAGQYTDLTISKPKFKDNMGETRSLSFLNRPEDKAIKFIFKPGISAFKLNLQSISEGEEVELSQAKGKFVCKDINNSVFIGAGVGIAPILSIITSHQQIPYKCLFSFSTLSDVPYLDYLEKFSELFITKEISKHNNRRISKEDLTQYTDKNFYICGSSGFVSTITSYLENLKISQNKIYTEDFIGY